MIPSPHADILHIDNLWQFTGLCHLQLDNNIIEEVKGLESLTQLQWLDLSFNNITIISGLSNLTNLTDLSLAHNRISKIENLESLTKLQVFSIANNLISEFQNVGVCVCEFCNKFVAIIFELGNLGFSQQTSSLSGDVSETVFTAPVTGSRWQPSSRGRALPVVCHSLRSLPCLPRLPHGDGGGGEEGVT